MPGTLTEIRSLFLFKWKQYHLLIKKRVVQFRRRQDRDTHRLGRVMGGMCCCPGREDFEDITSYPNGSLYQNCYCLRCCVRWCLRMVRSVAPPFPSYSQLLRGLRGAGFRLNGPVTSLGRTQKSTCFLLGMLRGCNWLQANSPRYSTKTARSVSVEFVDNEDSLLPDISYLLGCS